MPFDRAGFTKAAQAMGYTPDEINMVATLREAQENSPAGQQAAQEKQLDLESKKLTIQNTRNSLSEENAKRNFKFSGDYKRDLETAGAAGIPVANINAYYGPKQKELQKTKENALIAYEIESNAAKLAAVIEAKRQGKLKGQDYKTAYEFAASNYAASRGFKEGGKALTGPELAQLAGSIPRTKQQTIIDQWLGNPPSGRVMDSEDVLLRKSALAMSNSADPALSAKGKKILASLKGTGSSDKSVGGFVGNVGNNLKDLGNAVLGAPASVMQENQRRASEGKLPLSLPDIVVPGVKGIASSVNETLGRPLEGGDIVGRIGEHAYEKPVDTALTVLPMIKGVKGLRGSTAAKEATTLPSIGAKTQGKAATSIGITNPESVLKSEAQMGEALRMTKSLTRRGMARELESFTPKAGRAIDDWTLAKDKAIGFQPSDEISSVIKERLLNTTVGRTNPELVNKIMLDLDKKLDIGQLSSEKATMGTNLQSINEARKTYNSGLSRWFEQGSPVDEGANGMHALEWETSNALKDILAQADETGQLKQLIHQQHVALQTSPTLSKLALANNPSSSIWTAAYNTVKKALNTVTEPVQISGARALQGKGGVATLPEITAEGTTMAPTGPISQGTGRIPLPAITIENVLEKMPPAQRQRLIRDMRYSQGTWVSRGEQDKLLRQVPKRKYK